MGDREHRRETDIATGAISPQKLYGTPVGLMFFEGAPRLLEADVTIPHIRQGDPDRIAIEAYPGVLARSLIGRRSYKNDAKKKQTAEQAVARCEILRSLKSSEVASRLGFHISADPDLAEDPGGDHLDALLCAVQSAWSWTHRHAGYGAGDSPDPLEGWIANPAV
ncbi:uncharacterized protein DUF429 [Rhodovulum imhoffii]|uniref:Uncharacterized protein DUF429 n=1 Tax=Rhodovulum imhoffii TaxID=365340 RepID=A0A2T5BTH5_9RHOB|nr:DUF429 domain-containing protein [Rhodovulum imhoffii]PTN02737.1 uncharacterized protein DUF429 [Rhodovulum imhoffii]